jgi:DNA-binding transcriptional ArsR family regulator
MKAKTMKLKLLLKKNGDVLFEMPLSMEEWTKPRLERELAFSEAELERFSKLFDALSHGTRLKMMKHLLEDEDLALGFGDFMRDLRLNPKTVWESSRKLQEGGLMVKSKDGKYRASELGAAEFLLLSLTLRRLFKAVEEL